MSDYHAKVGNKVSFFFSNGKKIFGDVLSIPDFAGEEWIIQSYEKGEKDLVVYILQYDFMCVYPDTLETPND